MAANQGNAGQGNAGQENQGSQFALFPGMIINNQNNFLDFSLSENQKLYKEGCAALDFTFDGKPEQLLLFKEHLSVRATKMNWWDAIDIPIDPTDPNSDTRNVITQHGQLDTEAIVDWATDNIIDEETRLAQDNHMMFTCLSRSISDDVMKKIVPDRDEYIIERVPIAALYFKLLISKAELESRATTSNIRSKMVNLHNYIAKINYDVPKFHDYVNELLTTLSAYGEVVDNNNDQTLTIALFDAYNIVPDVEFHNLISNRRSDYLLSNDDIAPKQLMNYAQSIYDYRNEDRLTAWLSKSKDQLQIEALNAQVQSLKSENKKLSYSKKDNKKKTELSKLAAAATTTTKKDGGDKSKSDKVDKTDKKSKWAWKKIPPKDGEKDTKEYGGKTYHWCLNHKAWTVHKTSECRGVDYKKKGNSNNDGATTAMTAQAQAALAMLAQATAVEDEE